MTGIDEAGRGCLAGPVVVAAVTWRPSVIAEQPWFPLLADSKTLDEKKRDLLFPLILEHADRVRTAFVGNILIDYLNILRATLHGFECVAPAFDATVPLIIDGNQKPPTLPWAKTLVKGDSRASAVAAGGIVAKVLRDAVMKRHAAAYPAYAFEVHKGYATKKHRDAVSAHGNTPLHRKSFKPCSLLPDDDAQGALLQQQFATAGGDHAALVACWRSLQAQYHRLPLAVVRELLPQLNRAGLSILPCAADMARLATPIDPATTSSKTSPCQNDVHSLEAKDPLFSF